MPGINGFEAIATLRENPHHKDIPVIFLTSRDDEESAVKGLDLGAADYVTKPFSGPLLLKRINNILLIEQLKKELQTSEQKIAQLQDEEK